MTKKKITKRIQEEDLEQLIEEELSDHCPVLTLQQRRFVDEYLVDLNASRAYRAAGYKAKGKNVSIGAWFVLRSKKVQAAIKWEQEERRKRTHVTQDRVVMEIARLAFSDITQVMSWNAQGVDIFDSKTLPPHVTAAIASVSCKYNDFGPQIEIKMHTKSDMLNMLAQHLGIVGAQKGGDKPGANETAEKLRKVMTEMRNATMVKPEMADFRKQKQEG
jgi:phage terminase small subunit